MSLSESFCKVALIGYAFFPGIGAQVRGQIIGEVALVGVAVGEFLYARARAERLLEITLVDGELGFKDSLVLKLALLPLTKIWLAFGKFKVPMPTSSIFLPIAFIVFPIGIPTWPEPMPFPISHIPSIKLALTLNGSLNLPPILPVSFPHLDSSNHDPQPMIPSFLLLPKI